MFRQKGLFLNKPKPFCFMESTQSSELFSLTIDPVTKLHLAETARWGRFLAIVGFIMSALILLLGIFFGSFFSMFNRSYEGYSPFGAGMGAFMIVIYVIIALLYFFPCLFLFRFANKMKAA